MMKGKSSYFGAEFFVRENEDEDDKVRMDSESFSDISESCSDPPLDKQALVVHYGNVPMPVYEEKEDKSLPFRTLEVTKRVAEVLDMDLPDIKKVAVPVKQQQARDEFSE